MSRPNGLLRLARRLVTLDPTRPQQVTLGRAVSTAYYAVFGLLAEEVARLFVTKSAQMISKLARTVDHKPLKEVSGQIIEGKWPNALNPVPAGFVGLPDLTQVAKAIVRLQSERHRADYDQTYSLTRTEATELVDMADAAFAAWRRVRLTDAARLYLGCFLLWKTWNDKPSR